eukprot:768702-Hanusia_phi.AAC.4
MEGRQGETPCYCESHLPADHQRRRREGRERGKEWEVEREAVERARNERCASCLSRETNELRRCSSSSSMTTAVPCLPSGERGGAEREGKGEDRLDEEERRREGHDMHEDEEGGGQEQQKEDDNTRGGERRRTLP